jgi:hypothetical protein
MTDYTPILIMLGDLQQQIEDIKDELGKLQAQASMVSSEVGLPGAPVAPPVIPPTAPEVEIVGGEETDGFPDCCAVGNDKGYYCSGTLIARNIVVTADHCTQATRVFLKGNDISRPEEGETVRVVQRFSHPEVDLLVLVLERDSQVRPRHVAQGAETANAEMATAAGFGTIDVHGTVGYGRKRKVEVPITSLDGSEPGAPKIYGCLPGREIVAGHRGLLRDSCRGDSGGPLYIQNAAGEYYLLGATSRGTRDSFTTCGDGGIYVRVDLCLDWIREMTGADIEGPRI